MRIDGRIPEGYVLLCDCDEAFVVPRLDLSVQCPSCGAIALGADLAADFHLQRAAATASSALETSEALPA